MNKTLFMSLQASLRAWRSLWKNSDSKRLLRRQTYRNDALIYFSLLTLSAILFPHSVFASTTYIDTDHKNFFVGDTILFSVRIDSENKDINTIEGEVWLDYLAGSVSLTDISTPGPEFSLWPNKPFPSENNTSISFVGGSPGGLISKNAIVFNFVLKLNETGEITLSPNKIKVYLNDGKGTKDQVSVKDLVINVLPKKSDARPTDDWDAIISNDKTAPEPFEITLGKNPSVFDNQYFISFFSTDAESGIAYYEVQEGTGNFVKAESPYLLQRQSLKNIIRVKAIDEADNARTEEWIPPTPSVPPSKNILFWVIVSFIVMVFALWRIFKRKMKK